MSTGETGARIGLLMAAGRGSRFDPSGYADKLLAPVDGVAAVLRAHAALAAAVDAVIAVVRPDARGERVAAPLRQAGCEVAVCADADHGMGHSLACAARHAARRGAAVVVVMLGDMPFVRADTVARIASGVRSAADIVAPHHAGRRGHPVAFGAAHLPALADLQGDRGAAGLLARHRPIRLDVDDAGVLLDVDTPADLDRGGLPGEPG